MPYPVDQPGRSASPFVRALGTFATVGGFFGAILVLPLLYSELMRLDVVQAYLNQAWGEWSFAGKGLLAVSLIALIWAGTRVLVLGVMLVVTALTILIGPRLGFVL